jgi:N-methylhydantoinase B
VTRPGVIDPIALEVLRTRLVAVSDEAADAIGRTSSSPIATDSKDYSAVLVDADGRLMSGGGCLELHFGASAKCVQSIIATHGTTIAPGDIFLTNDPHQGGGLHAQDVLVSRPLYYEGVRIAWIVNSAHMIDMGGMTFGSFAPDATDCIQEALRFPPVRLAREGTDQNDIWAIVRNNVRVSALVEMDLRALIAGCQVAQDKLELIVERMGSSDFLLSVAALSEVTERELRRRIASLTDGTYEVTGWIDWEEELHPLPCVLTIHGDDLVVDFSGAAAQTLHYFNSKQHIVESYVVSRIFAILGRELPLTHGIFAPIDVRCPPGSIVDSNPPAPVAAANLDVAGMAGDLVMRNLLHAIAATSGVAERGLLGGDGMFCSALQTFAATGLDGTPDGWLFLDGRPGSSAGIDRDGVDSYPELVGPGSGGEIIDVEVLESWYPLLYKFRKRRVGVTGAGTYRAGAGVHVGFTPHDTDAWTGVMLAWRGTVPQIGWAGGMPGVPYKLQITRAAGEVEDVSGRSQGVRVYGGDLFEALAHSGAGYGDPLDRQTDSVAADVHQGRLSVDEAATTYGVVIDGSDVDAAASERLRDSLRSARLTRARSPERPFDDAEGLTRADGCEAQPLYPGICQRGSVAFSEGSGVPLASAPNDWPDGCPTVRESVSFAHGVELDVMMYLDPATGRSLFVDVVPAGQPRSFRSLPAPWVAAGKAPESVHP